MKYTSLTALVVVFLLAIAPTVSAQPDPPGGWLLYGTRKAHQVVPNQLANLDLQMCRSDYVYSPGRYSRPCERLQRWRDVDQPGAYEYNDYGAYGYRRESYDSYGYGSYGRDRRGRTAEIAILGGLQLVDMALDHRRGNDARRERAADRAAEGEAWQQEQRNAEERHEEALEEIRSLRREVETLKRSRSSSTRAVVNSSRYTLVVKTTEDTDEGTTLKPGGSFTTTTNLRLLRADAQNDYGQCSVIESTMTADGRAVELTCQR